MSSHAEPQTDETLMRLGERPKTGAYLKGIWNRREFLWDVPMGNLRAQNMDTVLGNLWNLLNPLLLLGVYFLVFDVVLQVTRVGVPEGMTIPFLAIGVFLFHWGQRSGTGGAKSITGNEGIIRALTFPRALMPLSSTIQQTMAFAIPLAVMVSIILLYRLPITPMWLLVPALVTGYFFFNVGVSFVLARITNLFKDMENLLTFVYRLLFYLSGVIYSVEGRMGVDGWQANLFSINPYYSFITSMRHLLMGLPMTIWPVVSMAAWTLVLAVGGFFFFKAGEQEYGRA